MLFSEVLQRFVDHKPICVMVRALLEYQFSPARLDALFEQTAQRQYTKELAFSTCARLLAQVTLGTAASVHAAFRADRETIPVSVVAVYDKLKHTEPAVCESLVAQTAADLAGLIRHLKGRRPEPVKGLRLRILDGNQLAGTEHRLQELRRSGAAALPGLTLALYDYGTGLIDELVVCEDGHANERKLLPGVLTRLAAQDLLLGDCNFCTLDFLAGLQERRARFDIRHHGGLKLPGVTDWRAAGRCRTGWVFERQLQLSSGLRCRVLRIERDKPLRRGGRRVLLLTNVPRSKASAKVLADLYLKRWTIEEAFRQLTQYLACEVRTLGYPKAALLAFSLAVLAYNCLAGIRGALARVHGRERVDAELSSYYLAWEVKATYEGMAVAVAAAEWQAVGRLSAARLANLLVRLARRVDWSRYRKSPRGPKKSVKRRKVPRGYHVSTAQVLEQRKKPKGRAKGAARP
jgi:hypothetical protein